MPIAAVPDYLQKDDPELYHSTPPGHRFLLHAGFRSDPLPAKEIRSRLNRLVGLLEETVGNAGVRKI